MSSTQQEIAVQTILQEIDHCLLHQSNSLSDSSRGNSSQVRFRRAFKKEDIHAIDSFITENLQQSNEDVTEAKTRLSDHKFDDVEKREVHHPLYFYILLEEKIKSQDEQQTDNSNTSLLDYSIQGVALWYFGYSTWKGKVMNLESLITSTDLLEKRMMDVLIHLARRSDCQRIIYQVQGKDNAEVFKEKYNPELLHEWLTLEMGKEKIVSFLQNMKHKFDTELLPTNSYHKSIDKPTKNNMKVATKDKTEVQYIQETLDSILINMNIAIRKQRQKNQINSSKAPLRLRRAEENDSSSILKLVNGLALYEKALDEVHVNEVIYQRDGGGDHPFFHCILLEEDENEEDKIQSSSSHHNNNNSNNHVVGMGFFYFGHAMKSGRRFLYLEDLFVESNYRKGGYGTAVMTVLANLANELNCDRFVWQALDWNSPALAFYDKVIGATVCNGLYTLRFDKARMSMTS